MCWLALKLAESLEEPDKKESVDNDAGNMQGRISQEQQGHIGAIEQHADHKGRFAAMPGKDPQQNKNSNNQSIDQDDSSRLSFAYLAGGEPYAQHNRRAEHDQQGIDGGKDGDDEEDGCALGGPSIRLGRGLRNALPGVVNRSCAAWS